MVVQTVLEPLVVYSPSTDLMLISWTRTLRAWQHDWEHVWL